MFAILRSDTAGHKLIGLNCQHSQLFIRSQTVSVEAPQAVTEVQKGSSCVNIKTGARVPLGQRNIAELQAKLNIDVDNFEGFADRRRVGFCRGKKTKQKIEDKLRKRRRATHQRRRLDRKWAGRLIYTCTRSLTHSLTHSLVRCHTGWIPHVL